MRVEVDLDLCQGHAMCELEAPDVFAVGRDKVALRQTEPGLALHDAVRRAVRYCPTQALRLTETVEKGQ